jgi:integrase/recombinase XerD
MFGTIVLQARSTCLLNNDHVGGKHNSMDVRTALNDYYSSITLLQPLTQAGYRQRLDVFCAWCEAQQPPIALEHINAQAVNRFVEHLKVTHKSHKVAYPELSTFTLVGYVRNIQFFLNWCLGEEAYDTILRPSTIRRIKRPRVAKYLIEIFTQEQLQGLFDACEQEFTVQLQDRNRTIVAVLLDTGLRASELCHLTIGNTHLDPRDPYVKVMGKGLKEREVGPLGKLARKELKHYLDMYRKGAELTDLVFLNRFSKPLTVSGLEDIITTLGERAGITGVRCSPTL